MQFPWLKNSMAYAVCPGLAPAFSWSGLVLGDEHLEVCHCHPLFLPLCCHPPVPDSSYLCQSLAGPPILDVWIGKKKKREDCSHLTQGC